MAMNTTHVEVSSLRDRIAKASAERFFCDRTASVCFTKLSCGTSLDASLSDLVGRSVLIATASQLTTALALTELDGRVRRMSILPPDIEANQIDAVIRSAEIDAVVIDAGTPQYDQFHFPFRAVCTPSIAPRDRASPASLRTEWMLLTSGTSGVPKIVMHDLASLTAAIAAASPADGAAVWGTFYDIRRYGGLQIFLRSVLGNSSLVLSNADEPTADHLVRLAQNKVTHLSGTPSHWRRALMNSAIGKIAPRYVRLSGEIADQTILNALRAAFPAAAVGHAYASTEAGVAFDVNDGMAGFPLAYVGEVRDGVEMKVLDGALRIRSPRTALRYVGTAQSLADEDGFVDTGDLVEQRGGRYYFVGRKGGIINVGGLKFPPEEVEAVINQHPQVRMSLVTPRKSPITGSIVVADVVLKLDGEATTDQQTAIRDDILRLCQAALPRHKVPAAISFVPSLSVTAAGKLARRG
jgi:acyl-coenzyme A synthetase/AMP-(fatty) acid ligase